MLMSMMKRRTTLMRLKRILFDERRNIGRCSLRPGTRLPSGGLFSQANSSSR